MSDELKVKWACPNCGAEPEKHGKGGEEKCLARGGGCSGFLCDCSDTGSEGHGTFADPCPESYCYHCRWGGVFPPKPKGLLPWEKKALEAGWTPPSARQKELGFDTKAGPGKHK